jgi:hypothetical protein
MKEVGNPLSDVELVLNALFGTKLQDSINELADTNNGRPLVNVIKVEGWPLTFERINKNVDE